MTPDEPRPLRPASDDVEERLRQAVAQARSTVRRDRDREVTPGRKAARTRAGLLRAAHDLFIERGYGQTAVGDIAAAAGVSLGTYYQYFRDRADVMTALVGEAVLDALESRPRWDSATGRSGVVKVLRGFVGAYVATAPFQAVWEEVTHVDDSLAGLRRDLARVYTLQIEAELERARDGGWIRADVDPAATARALAAMVDRHCYVTYVFDPPPGGPPPAGATVEVLADLWVGAVGLTERTARRRRRQA